LGNSRDLLSSGEKLDQKEGWEVPATILAIFGPMMKEFFSATEGFLEGINFFPLLKNKWKILTFIIINLKFFLAV